MINLNQQAVEICDTVIQRSDFFRVHFSSLSESFDLIDFGVETPGSLAGGLRLAEVCMGGLGTCQILNQAVPFPMVQVEVEHPMLACMAAQYAGWKIDPEGYFAMCSGPVRAGVAAERVLQHYRIKETNDRLVAVFEAGILPNESIFNWMQASIPFEFEKLIVCVAPTASIAGTVQIVARSVETAIHKLFELEFDLRNVISAIGSAPLPPVASNDLEGIGLTNDAILYGSNVTLWVDCHDQNIIEIGEKIPSSASPDFGEPFGRIFDRYDGDFYKIDPLLFSPAAITLVNLATGNSFSYGTTHPDILSSSFASVS